MFTKMAKGVVGFIAPAYVYHRFIRIMTLKERELLLLPLLCDNKAVAIDIGANKGLYVHHLRKITDRVVAFEPLPPMAKVLKERYGGSIDLKEIALSSAEGSLELRFPSGVHSWATLEASNTLDQVDPSSISRCRVEVKTLDSFRFTDVGLIKIDVEGHEEAVLTGGKDTVARCRPCLIVEIEERHKQGSVERIRSLMKQAGYDGYYVSGDDVACMEDFDPNRDQRPDDVGLAGKTGRYINNFVFLPREKAAGFRESARRSLHQAAPA